MQHRSGFTLLELSVVIVIIALIIGGIVASQNMINNAKLQAAMAEQDMYAKAIREFADKYQAMPGDMNNAATVWGTDVTGGTCPANTARTALSATSTDNRLTCNGNGDGMIGNWTNGATTNIVTLNTAGATLAATASEFEWYRAWQHLSNANLIDGMYTGVRAAATTTVGALRVNIPASKVTPAGWTLLHVANSADNNWFFIPASGHVLLLGAATAAIADGAALLPADALNIDTKLDDGMPLSGNIRTNRSVHSASQALCVNAGTITTTTYTATYTTAAACNLYFFLGF